MNRIVIYGDSALAQRMYQYIQMEHAAEVLCFTTAAKFMTKEDFCGLPVIAAEDLHKRFEPSSFSVLIAAGYSRMNGIRSQIYTECKEAGMKIATFISSSARIDTVNIGEGCIILPNCYIGPGCKVGICNILACNSILSHDCAVGDFNYISVAAVFGGFSKITHHCFIGLNSTIRDGIKLAPYTLVGSAANVLKSTEEYGIYTGNPARMANGKKSTDASI